MSTRINVSQRGDSCRNSSATSVFEFPGAHIELRQWSFARLRRESRGEFRERLYERVAVVNGDVPVSKPLDRRPTLTSLTHRREATVATATQNHHHRLREEDKDLTPRGWLIGFIVIGNLTNLSSPLPTKIMSQYPAGYRLSWCYNN